MLFSYNILRRYVDIDLDPFVLADRLTMQGLEVEEISCLKFDFKFFRVVCVREVRVLGGGDYFLIRVFDGKSFYKAFSAKNFVIGDFLCFAFNGAMLPFGGEVIGSSFDGEVSDGKILTFADLSKDCDDINAFILPDYAQAGDDINFYVFGDHLYLKVVPTSNRADCLSLVGISREISVLNRVKFSYPDCNFNSNFEIDVVDIRIDADDVCLRYCGRSVLGVKVGSSPDWLRDALLSFGIRPVNNVVDVANYVAFEFGHPLHAYDLDKISGGVCVRKASDGEKIDCINAKDFVLREDMLVVADEDKAIGIAGILGGDLTCVSEGTVNLFLEVAAFDAENISKTSLALRLSTDASAIFERGVDIDFADRVLDRFTFLILKICGGNASRMIDIYPQKKSYNEFRLRSCDIFDIIGFNINLDECREYLEMLGYDVIFSGDDFLDCRVPHFRKGIDNISDVVEDIMRIYGYDNIELAEPFTFFNLKNKFPFDDDFENEIKKKLISFGLSEIFSSSFLYERDLPSFDFKSSNMVVVNNPLTLDHKYLRKDLFFSAINASNYNFYNGFRSLSFFEIANVFFRKGDEFLEQRHLSISLYGFAFEKSLYNCETMFDIFDLKGIFESLLLFSDKSVRFFREDNEYFTFYESFGIFVDDIRLGFLGRCSRDICADYKLGLPLFYGEINLDILFSFFKDDIKLYKPISKFPAVFRDLVIMVDEGISADLVSDQIFSSSFVYSAEIVDVYRGANIDENKKSLAFKIIFQSDVETLSSELIDKEYDKIVDRIRLHCFGEMRAI